jgi:SAM-dependent methyltransferase
MTNRFLGAARRGVQRIVARWPLAAGHYCCLCGRRVQRFLPYRHGLSSLPTVAREADIIGSDVENFECPSCGCHDRERHLSMYLHAAGLMTALRSARILHFAPERQLQRVIAQSVPLEYLRADLHPAQRGVMRVDLTNMPFPDDRFDLVIANHVLEHVSDDAKALREIRRVLRPSGHAVLQTPYASQRASTHEDAGIATEHERLQAYGQEDHVRLYGSDFAQRVVSFGFVSKVARHDELLPAVDVRACGVNPREPFHLFAKVERA